MSLCEAGNSLLVVVDVQERLAAAMPQPAFGEMLAGCSRLLDAADLLDVPVIATEQYPRGLGATLPAISGRLPANTGTVEKTCFSCAGADAFLALLENSGRRQIILTGMEAHVCILQTALQLRERDLEVFVVEDAVCSRYSQHCSNALQRLRHAGVVVSNSESVIFEWLQDAGHEQFKAVTALLK